LEASAALAERLSTDRSGSLSELFSIFANKPQRMSHTLRPVVVTYVELQSTEDLDTKLYMFKAAAFGKLALMAARGVIDDGDICTFIVGEVANVPVDWH
jgi:hypothetical protein